MWSVPYYYAVLSPVAQATKGLILMPKVTGPILRLIVEGGKSCKLKTENYPGSKIARNAKIAQDCQN
jgi:hypothetical protein